MTQAARKGQARKRRNGGRKASVISAERMARAIELRRQAFSYREIGREMKISAMGAHKLVQKALDALCPVEDREEVRRMELERCDTAEHAIVDRVEKGDLDAIGVALKIRERRARLTGIEKPVPIAPTNPNGDEPYDPGAFAAGILGRLVAQATRLDAPAEAGSVDSEPRSK